MPKPLLSPPCPAWKEDLPGPCEKVMAEALTGKKSPNHLSRIYLEIPRTAISPRGVMSAFIILTTPILLLFVYNIFFVYNTLEYEPIMLNVIELTLIIWFVSMGLRVDIAPPRDLPLRFNRARQRIYAYNFHYRWWNPFEKWRVVAVSYDWAQVRAERWSQTGAVSGGLIFKWGVELSIIKTGTNEVIDRFNLSTMDADVQTWAYICTYMQEGPEALPPPGPPKDHNDLIWCEVALRLAPKVSWPPDMDLESRTAP